MVQTLAKMLMSYVQRPTLRDCLVVSKAVHEKFKFLGDESSEVITLLYVAFHYSYICFHQHRMHGSGSCTPGLKM